jgi:hypothetical protein
MTFSMLDELVDAVKDLGADCLMVRSEHLRAYRALLRTVNAGPSEIMVENFGRPMLTHNGIPFIVNDFIPVTDGAAPFTACTCPKRTACPVSTAVITLVSLLRISAPFRTKTPSVPVLNGTAVW